MSEDIQNSAKKKSVNTNGTVPIMDIVFITLRHWPWILLSVFICVGVTYLKLRYTPNVYTRSAEILIKKDSKGKSVEPEEFANLGLIQSNTNLQNEISSLKSKDLMEEVVRRLGLDVNYYHEGRFHDIVAYGYDLPVKVSAKDFPADSSLSFNLEVDKNGEVKISDMASPGKDAINKVFSGVLNEPIETPFGNFVVSPTHVYKEGKKVELKVKKSPLSAARDSYNARLKVIMTNEKGSVLSLTLADQSTQRADDVLNMLINVYNENWMRDRNQVAVSTSNFINDRLGVIENELGNVDSDISSYKSATLTPNVNAAASMYMSQNQQIQAQLLDLNNQLSMARYIRSYLTADDNRDQLLPSSTGLNNSNVTSLIGEYNDNILQRNALVAKSSIENPLVQQLDAQLNQQRQAIISTIDNEIVALDTQMNSLRGSEAQTVAKLSTNPDQAKNLLSVERQQKVKESLYLYLLQKREENELSQAFTAYNTRVINKPGNSGIAPTPDRHRILSIAFLIGLAIPFAFFFVKETLNTKVRGRKDIEDLLPPFLGEIPEYGGNRKKEGRFGKEKQVKAIVVKAGKRDVINEAFRVMRTNLEFMKIHKDEADVVAITSFNPGSGKSFLTMNLAFALAIKNKRVLVIDGDMRHGSSSAYIGSPETGLTDVLSGKIADVHQTIVTDEKVPMLNVLPVGTIPPNPTELLETARFAQIISELRKQYDYILIDCPPIEVVADAQIIDKIADRTIFVLRAGLLERSMLPQVDKLYEEKKYKNMAIILNGTSSGHSRYGYSHSYRYGYGYGYGYGYNYNHDKKGDGKSSNSEKGKWLDDK